MWVGCGGALVERNRNTVRATAKLLKKAGVKFAILGREESCSGDPARRVGNEFLFEMLAKGNVETLDRYGVRKVVTSCPHCFNSFKNEYPQFGGQYEVLHHTQFLDQLVGSGQLQTNGLGRGSKRRRNDHVPRSLLPRPPQRRIRRAPQPAGEARRRPAGRDAAQSQPELLLRRRRRHGLCRRAA